ncbi:MAG: type II toxin-antitoxin system PemK/MazF family toxin [Propionibacteriaceae bacterium]|nr:type II toxin-antitoxin system PemK/MazF family toxin [Propionibacteriaceae bacterium]
MELSAGQVWWARPDPAVGREQSGRRPLLIVAHDRYHTLMTTLTLAVPLTTTDRGWPNHVPVCELGGEQASYAMTEQVRVVSRDRLTDLIGTASPETLTSIRSWVEEYLSE